MPRPILLFHKTTKQWFYELDRDFGIFVTENDIYGGGKREPRKEWTDESLILRILLALKSMEESGQKVYPDSLVLKDLDDKALIRKIREVFPNRFSDGKLRRIILRKGRRNPSVQSDDSPPMGLPRLPD